MQTPKRGNPRRAPRRRRPPVQCRPVESTQPAPVTARLMLHDTDLITGNEESLSTLFYESYRGYTIYSTAQGRCCMHGAGRQGCLCLHGKFVSFPDIEDARTLIKYFRTQGIRAWESMDRAVPREVYVWVNRQEQLRTPTVSRPMQRVS